MGEQEWLEKRLFEWINSTQNPELAISAANLIRNVTVNGTLRPLLPAARSLWRTLIKDHQIDL